VRRKAKIFDAKTQRRKGAKAQSKAIGKLAYEDGSTLQIAGSMVSILSFFASLRLCVEDRNAGAKPAENIL